jgi:UDP-2-acetamido-3-amino-2,3-dideoxy-glucuronate N-acetyltransferase
MNYYKHPTAIVESDNIGEGSKVWHFVHIRENVEIGKNCNIGKSVYVDAEVKIGYNVKIQNFSSIYKGVKLEDDVFVGPSVVFTNDLYPRAFIWGEDRIVQTVVKKGSSIGANSTIICGLTIGEYAMVGAGSVVTKDVPPFGLVFGNPARLRGFVCYCGKKLSSIIEKKEEEIVYNCECGKGG